MKTFKYNLDRSSKKFQCPSCNKKTLVRFIDTDRNYIEEKFGRCDREDRCGYFAKPNDADDYVFVPRPAYIEKPVSYIPFGHAQKSFVSRESNPLFKLLANKVGLERVERAMDAYRVGVDNSNSNWMIFWQFDQDNRIRSGKMIRYDTNGHRSKEHQSTWYHKKHIVGKPVFPDFNLKQCLFGEHLIGIVKKPIAIVESEKTAVIASLFLDGYLWLACGGKSQLTAEKLAILKNRDVTLFPDLGGYEEWRIKAKEFVFKVSDHIERIATDADKEKGLDLADYLLR